jgi:hypothetical protein
VIFDKKLGSGGNRTRVPVVGIQHAHHYTSGMTCCITLKYATHSNTELALPNEPPQTLVYSKLICAAWDHYKTGAAHSQWMNEWMNERISALWYSPDKTTLLIGDNASDSKNTALFQEQVQGEDLSFEGAVLKEIKLWISAKTIASRV